MKEPYRFSRSPEIDYNGNFVDFGKREELLEMLGFCDLVGTEAQCSRTDNTEEKSPPAEVSEYFYPSSSLSAARFPDISLTQGSREHWH
jgi:hypothetical protein